MEASPVAQILGKGIYSAEEPEEEITKHLDIKKVTTPMGKV